MITSKLAVTFSVSLAASVFFIAGCGATATGPTSANAPTGSGATASAPSTGSGTDAGACKLLTEGDVTAAMRQAMKISGGSGSAICSYSATADPSVLLYVNTFATQADMATDLQVESSSDHIAGLGDDAFWNSTLDLVFVRSGDRGFAVTSPSLANLAGDPQASKAALIGLARIALKNL
jgi:hypothetical protein